ncbi:MAG: hypothetical protein R3C68_16380 [Myxococcota bacterium]
MPMHDLEQNTTYIDKDSAPRILHFGEDFLLEDLPIGTRVIYPPQPLAGLENVDAAIITRSHILWGWILYIPIRNQHEGDYRHGRYLLTHYHPCRPLMSASGC